MREILFRGKRVDNGEWVEGSLIKYCFGKLTEKYVREAQAHSNTIVMLDGLRYGFSIKDSVYPFPEYDIIFETVGQYTGLTDKNGKKVFEGDIVKIVTRTCSSKEGQIGYIEYSTDCACYFIIHSDTRSNDLLGNFFNTSLEVIGNIHDKEENNG